jgi:cytochrome c biogenesis protein CcmG, thiol:disulfide interchange protein DsbE
VRFLCLLFGLVLAVCAYGQSASGVTVSTLDGRELSLDAVARGGPTFVTFWALWCSPCKQELRALQSLQAKYAPKGFTVVAVNQDNSRSMAKVRSYVASQSFTFAVGLDPNGQLLQEFNGQAIPYSVFLDSTGTVIYSSIGYLPGDESMIEEKLLSMLAGR